MNGNILLFTKDAFCTAYLPCYGNTYWKGNTPNIDELVEQGTLYTNFYTAAPSSAMAYMAMFTGKYPYEHEIKTYVPMVKSYSGKTLFDIAVDKGYECHVMWDEIWTSTSYRHSMCYGKSTVFHALNGLRQGVGFHYQHEGFLEPSIEKENDVLKMIEEEVAGIVGSSKKVFLWFHLPHVINGRVGYGSDIDLFDRILGIMRKYFDDSNIYISGDHGNLNGHRNRLGYGFHVYEPSIRIPLITPRKEGKTVCSSLMCNIDWDKIIFTDTIPIREYVISDSAYYGQPNRQTAILFKNYRYIYNKNSKSEELYDISWDPNQNFNLFDDKYYDKDRKVNCISRELYFYPYWDNLPEIRKKLRDIKDSMWRDSTMEQDLINVIRKNKFVRFFALPIKRLYVNALRKKSAL